MNKYISLVILLINLSVVFSVPVGAPNRNYIVGILRNEDDAYYDDLTVDERFAVDELVNERMNDIYQLIYDNRGTYNKYWDDSKLNELDKHFPLPENKKFKFLNNKSWRVYEFGNMVSDEYIPITSDLVSHICPIKNYYAVLVYLSDPLVNMVKELPNVIYVDKSSYTYPS